jgi:hypothetical protein
MEVKQIIQDVENTVAKQINTSSLNGGTGSATLTTRQDLDATIVNLAYRNTPFRDLVKRTAGQGQAFTFNTTEDLFSAGESSDPTTSIYSDGALPNYRTTKYGTKIVAYKAMGYAGSVTGLAQATASSLVDLYATEVERTVRRVIQAEEWLNFWGTTGASSYDGLDALITTNVIDAGGANISKALVDKAVKRIMSHGGSATHIFSSFGVQADINNLYNQYAQVLVSNVDQSKLTYGFNVPEIMTANGVLKVVGDFFINPANTYPNGDGSSSYPTGAATSTVFLLAMPYIEMRDLKSIGMEELGRVADKRDFFVNQYSALKLTAEPWCAKIINVAETTL